MWKAQQAGRTLHFRLAGINNQNFIMRDAETGSWWQQVSGRAIQGPLKGQQLEPAPWDEVSFAVWRQEHPETRVLKPDEKMKSEYAPADWEEHTARYPTVAPVDPRDALKPRDLVVGLSVGGAAKAYPWAALVAQNPIADSLGGTPLLLLLAADGRSLRCFDRRIDRQTLELYLKPGSSPPELVDPQTGSAWDFSGRATSGPLAGRTLTRVPCLKDFWFDWKNYHRETQIFSAGL